MSTASWLQPKRVERRLQARLGRAALAVLLWAATASGTSHPGGEAGAPPARSVRIQSEQLVAEMQAETVEFSGAVRVQGDGYTITADRLTIRFRPGSAGRKGLGGKVSAEDISRVTARGRVLIRTDTLTVRGEQAVYEADSGRIWIVATEGASPEGFSKGDPPPAASRRGAGSAASLPSRPRIRVQLLPGAVP
jgi:lipopolysaccharide export system protein LptA